MSLRKSRFQLRESRPQNSLLSEGPIIKVPPSQYQVGAAPNRGTGCLEAEPLHCPHS